MDILSLDSEDEANFFLDRIKLHAGSTHANTHVGAMAYVVGSRTEWYWITSGNKINYPIKWGTGEPSGTNVQSVCLVVRKQAGNNFFFAAVWCSTEREM